MEAAIVQCTPLHGRLAYMPCRTVDSEHQEVWADPSWSNFALQVRTLISRGVRIRSNPFFDMLHLPCHAQRLYCCCNAAPVCQRPRAHAGCEMSTQVEVRNSMRYITSMLMSRLDYLMVSELGCTLHTHRYPPSCTAHLISIHLRQ
jgi:hypothetical protein